MRRERKRTLFVSGGCKSGKSAFAQAWAEKCGAPRLYLATAEAGDAEMAERIRLHQQARGADWRTLEEPLEIEAALRNQANTHAVALLDCVTLWVANMLSKGYGEERITDVMRSFVRAAAEVACSVVVVTNEVGWGIVPETPLGREFRDLAGMSNQILASGMENAALLVSGIPLVLKGDIRVP